MRHSEPAAGVNPGPHCLARLVIRGVDLVSRSPDGIVQAWDPATLNRRSRGPNVRLVETEWSYTRIKAVINNQLRPAVNALLYPSTRLVDPAYRFAGPFMCCGPHGATRPPNGPEEILRGMWLVAGVGGQLMVFGRR